MHHGWAQCHLTYKGRQYCSGISGLHKPSLAKSYQFYLLDSSHDISDDAIDRNRTALGRPKAIYFVKYANRSMLFGNYQLYQLVFLSFERFYPAKIKSLKYDWVHCGIKFRL